MSDCTNQALRERQILLNTVTNAENIMTSKGSMNQCNQRLCDIPKFCKCPDLTKSKLKPLASGASGSTKCRVQTNASSILKKLSELVTDPVCNINTPRIRRYFEDFLTLNENEAFYVKDLDSLMCVLEFLALEARHVVEYQKYLDQILILCCTPPLLTKTSESLFCSEILEHYFTMFGYLLVILPTVREVLIVHRAIHQLLNRTKPAHIAAVKLEVCRRAVEASILPVTVTQILEIATDEVFPKMLETVRVLVSASHKCCFKMMEAGLFEHILIPLDPNYATRSHFEPPGEIPEEELDRDYNQFEKLILATNIMWELLHSVMPLNKSPDCFSGFKCPSQLAMWSLRYAFKREVRCTGRNQTSITMRNDLAAIMLAILATFPGWRFVESGLADDLAILAAANEIGTENTWASGVRLGSSNEDHRFKKILILIMCHLAKIGATVEIMKRRRFLVSILSLVNPAANEINSSRNETQFWDLHQYALHTLAVLLPLMPEDFIKHKGTNRLLMILEWGMSNDFDSQLILNCVKTVNSIVMSGIEIILKDFRLQGAVGTMIKLVQFVLSVSVLDSQLQRILTHATMILDTLIKDEKRYQTMYGEQSVKMVLNMMQRCLYDRNGYFQLDNRLAIALGTYIWDCVVRCSSNSKTFVERGGIFLMLDALDARIFPVRIIFMGALCDMCEEEGCETQLCTWRGENKELGLMSLLARIWREEEIRIRARRDKDGCIDDLELPLMGSDQWFTTFYSKRDHTISPSLSEMIGSCRPKIYGIKKILERNSARYELARDHYKILLHEIPKEDRITMVIIDHYFRLKQGEIWVEIHRDTERIGILPLRIEGEMISLMLQSYYKRSQFIQLGQEAILKESREAELRDEKATYKEIIDSKLAPTLDAFHQVDYISRTTDRRFMLRSKMRQRTEVDAALNFPKNVNSQLCHRTFLGKTNVTAIMDHQHTIPSEMSGPADSSEYKLQPVSPSISGLSTTSWVDTEIVDPLPCRACFASGLPCFHH